MPKPDHAASLLTPQAMGGLNGVRGYKAQKAYALVRLLAWLVNKVFASFMIEAAGDVDIRYQDDQGSWREYTQVKDFVVTPSQFKPILKEFQERKRNSGRAYKVFRLVCWGYNDLFGSLVEYIHRYREAQSFFMDGGAEVLDDTLAQVRDKATECGLTGKDVDFILLHVEFTKDPNLSDGQIIKERFIGRLACMYPYYASEVFERAYKDVYELLGNADGRETTREELERVISAAMSHSPQGHGPLEVLRAVKRGSLHDIVTAAEDFTLALDSDPYWSYVVGQVPGGGTGVSLVPKTPEAHIRAPLRLHLEPQGASLMDLVRQLFETGKSVSFTGKNVVSIGNRILLAEHSGTFEISIPVSLLVSTDLRMSVLTTTGEELSYPLRFQARGFEGTIYADNLAQGDSPVQVRLRLRVDSNGNCNAATMNFAPSDTGIRSAKRQLKFFRFLQAIGTDHKEVLFTRLLSDEPEPVMGGTINVADLDAQELQETINFWGRVVDLETKLRVSFSLPETISEEELHHVQYLWSLLVTGHVETQGSKGEVTGILCRYDPDMLRDAVSRDGDLHVSGTYDPEPMQLFGSEVIVPLRRFSMHPVRIKNRRAILRALKTSPHEITMVMVSGDSLNLSEELITEVQGTSADLVITEEAGTEAR